MGAFEAAVLAVSGGGVCADEAGGGSGGGVERTAAGRAGDAAVSGWDVLSAEGRVRRSQSRSGDRAVLCDGGGGILACAAGERERAAGVFVGRAGYSDGAFGRGADLVYAGSAGAAHLCG